MELVGVRQAAADIGVAHSSISRYLTKYPQLRRGKNGRTVLVDVEELKRHREENYSISGDGSAALAPAEQLTLGADQASPTSAAPTPAKPDADAGSALKHRELDAKTRSAESTALKGEIELARTQNETVPRVEVDEAVMDAAAVLQSRLLGRNKELADRLAGMTDAPEIAAFLDREDRRMLTAWADRFAQLADMDPSDTPDTHTDTAAETADLDDTPDSQPSPDTGPAATPAPPETPPAQ